MTANVIASLFEDYPTLPLEEAPEAVAVFDAADDVTLRAAWKLVGLNVEAFTRKAFYEQLQLRRHCAQRGRERGGRKPRTQS